jgi:hypothetical protein
MGKYNKNNESQDAEYINDYRVLYDQVVDSITVNYAEWSYL